MFVSSSVEDRKYLRLRAIDPRVDVRARSLDKSWNLNFTSILKHVGLRSDSKLGTGLIRHGTCLDEILSP